MNNVLSEKDYQKFLLERLADNGYVIRKASHFDRLFAMDREMLMKFLADTQPDTMDYLRKIYKDDLEDTIVSFINAETTKARGSLIDVLKHGIEISNRQLDLMYTKPATTFNPELTKKYGQNIFSVMEEVWASDKERIDVVIFLNGLAIISFELKCNTAGQSYQDAIYQYRTERNPKTRLFLFKSGCLVNFAMDLEEVYMTTKLAGEATFFLPFNMGNGEGVTAGAGNPAFEDRYSVSYMWEDILTKDTVLDLISKFIFVEVKEKVDDETGKVKRSENLIFPRYHQLDVIRKLLADVRENRTAQNYLIQHSAGSGKTNSIAWLAHRLTSLHDADNKIIFDNVIIVTDRVVVDRQLQKAIMGMEHKAGLIRVMDDKCNSTDLAIALNGNTKIIATTIQKFPYIVDSVKGLKNKRFAVIIDEAHSSTAGKDMAAVTMSLGSGEQFDGDVEEMLFFSNVDTIDPTTIRWSAIRFQRNNNTYRMLISLCQLILEGMLLTTDSGEYKLASFVDEQRMNRLYEKFILEYYAKECPQVTTTASQIPWALDDGIGTMLPVMQSDIMLTKDDTVLIIDAKYYTHTTQTQYDVHTLHSGNLYQIFTYVKNKDTGFGDKPHTVSGMLLYAATDEAIQPDNSYQMSGNKISVRTLDLNQEFSEIATQLNTIVDEHFSAS